MTSRTLKIVLAVSVALNRFAVAGGVAAVVTRAPMDQHVEAQQSPGRERAFRDIVAALDPQVRDRVRATLRASAMAVHPDFEDARAARREAIALTEAATFDPAAVDALLERSRAAEQRGRARLEHEAVALLATLGPQDRQALGVILKRHGRREGRDGAKSTTVQPETAKASWKLIG